MSATYDFAMIEPKWQAFWDQHQTFRTANPGEPGFEADRPKYYALDFFPYPSGAGLHVGHPEGYTATDILARFRRMRGYNVLHPMGWDAFGLPAEQYAIETNTHPRITTTRNIDRFRQQLKRLGFSYDWSREFATTDPDYYRWTQWIFLQLFNSYYDKAAGKARPITELEKRLESGRLMVRFDGEVVPGSPPGLQPIAGPPIGARAWGELSPQERRDVLDNHRLAYLADVPVNWCPGLGTVLANEEVTNEGRSERGDFPVFRRPLKQWMLRITAYADRLERDLDPLDWPESVKLMQRNWIGRSLGAEVHFGLDGSDESFTIFTTRPDTLYGATYMVLAPEHPLVEQVTTADQREAVRRYVAEAAKKTEIDRSAESKQKSGVFTGACAINPVWPAGHAAARLPIWIADYVLMGYGTGAIMAVPGSDLRDWQFARAFGLPIVPVVQPPEGYEPTKEETALAYDEGGRRCFPFVGDGTAINSPAAGIPADQVCDLNGLPTAEAKARIIDWLESRGAGRRRVNYKLRDWLFSRQRYWGEPFPVVHCPACGTVAVSEDQLPVRLPEMDHFQPTPLPDNSHAEPEPPLGRAAEWARTTCPSCGGPARRELNTMPNWAGSCWYYLRYCDPKNGGSLVGAEAERYWMHSLKKTGEPHFGGVDLYLGGAEHAVLHLLYARFWHKVLYDLGHVSTPEPFGKLFNQGMIRAFAYRDCRGVPVGYDEIDFRDEGAYHKPSGERLIGTVEKMSKSLKNVINPDDVVAEYGADSLRLYEMFMGPLEASKPWNPRDVAGVFRFLQRCWRLVVDPETGERSKRIVDPVEEDEWTAADGRRGPAGGEASSEWRTAKERESRGAAGAPAGDAFAAIEKALHRTIRKVSDDLDRMAFNTAIAAMMEFVNEATPAAQIRRDQLERFVLLLAPFAPHLAEELWQRLRGERWHASLAYARWPVWDESLVAEREVEIAVQVNGKVAATVTIPIDADEDTTRAAALADARVQARLAGKTVRKAIVVKGRLVNLVVG